MNIADLKAGDLVRPGWEVWEPHAPGHRWITLRQTDGPYAATIHPDRDGLYLGKAGDLTAELIVAATGEPPSSGQFQTDLRDVTAEADRRLAWRRRQPT